MPRNKREVRLLDTFHERSNPGEEETSLNKAAAMREVTKNALLNNGENSLLKGAGSDPSVFEKEEKASNFRKDLLNSKLAAMLGLSPDEPEQKEPDSAIIAKPEATIGPPSASTKYDDEVLRRKGELLKQNDLLDREKESLYRLAGQITPEEQERTDSLRFASELGGATGTLKGVNKIKSLIGEAANPAQRMSVENMKREVQDLGPYSRDSHVDDAMLQLSKVEQQFGLNPGELKNLLKNMGGELPFRKY
jgi:hypothetical protein